MSRVQGCQWQARDNERLVRRAAYERQHNNAETVGLSKFLVDTYQDGGRAEQNTAHRDD